jgi:hypothetical protein
MEANAIYIGNANNVTLVNNYLDGAAENVCVECSGTSIQNFVPSNITIQHNYFYKPPELANLQPAVYVKNLLEFKNGQNIVIDANVFEHSWVQNQNGHAILFTARTVYGAEPWNTVKNVRVTNNTIRSVAACFLINAYDDMANLPTSSLARTANFVFQNNLCTDVSGVKYAWGFFGMGWEFGGIPANLTATNNTIQFAADDFGQSRPPAGIWLQNSTDLTDSAWHNNVFGADLGGDGRYSAYTIASENNPYDAQLPNNPVVFDANNVVQDGSQYWQNVWTQAVPGLLFTPTPTSGADVNGLAFDEAQIKAGIYW